MFGTKIGTISSYSSTISELSTFVEISLGLGNSGALMSFSQTIKLLSKFRFISVYNGGLLEPFLAAGGASLEPATKLEKNKILNNTSSSRGKLTLYNKGVSTIDTFHYKTILYLISFLVRLFEKFLVERSKKKEKVNKVVFYIVFIHNRIHFVLFNIFISGGVFLNLRTLLHMKLVPDTWLLLVDKILAVFCFFFYWIDICEMYRTSTMYVPVPTNNTNKTSE